VKTIRLDFILVAFNFQKNLERCMDGSLNRIRTNVAAFVCVLRRCNQSRGSLKQRVASALLCVRHGRLKNTLNGDGNILSNYLPYPIPIFSHSIASFDSSNAIYI